MQQLLFKVECPVFGAHRWFIGNSNQGMCKCGAKHDFAKDNKRAFPEDYAKGYCENTKLISNLVMVEGYYMQGSLRHGGFDTHDDVDD